MAADWIKMRTDLYRDPKVCMIADHLLDRDSDLARYVNQHCQRDMTVTRNVTRNVTVGALVAVWGVTRHRGKRNGDDLFIKNATLAIIDDICDLPGFGEAMASVGWAVESDQGIVFPNFFQEFNADPHSDTRQKANERQQRYRERKKLQSDVTVDVTVTSQSDSREEKEREKRKSKKKTIAEPSSAVVSDPSITSSTPEKANDTKLRQRDSLFDALVLVTGSDPKVNGSQIGKTCSVLRKAEPPYTPEEIQRFADPEFLARELPWLNGTKPTIGAIEKFIGRIRSPSTGSPAQKSARGGVTKGEAFDNYFAEQAMDILGG
jgi:hypothetical protein